VLIDAVSTPGNWAGKGEFQIDEKHQKVAMVPAPPAEIGPRLPSVWRATLHPHRQLFENAVPAEALVRKERGGGRPGLAAKADMRGGSVRRMSRPRSACWHRSNCLGREGDALEEEIDKLAGSSRVDLLPVRTPLIWLARVRSSGGRRRTSAAVYICGNGTPISARCEAGVMDIRPDTYNTHSILNSNAA